MSALQIAGLLVLGAGVLAAFGCLVLLMTTGIARDGVIRRWLDRRLFLGATNIYMLAVVGPMVGCAAAHLWTGWLLFSIAQSGVPVTDFLANVWPRIRRRLARGGEKGRAVLARMLARLKPAPVLRPKPVTA